jgi:hypothetical protein
MSNGIASPLSPADNPAVTAHLNMIQGVITRMANNSMSCKTWCLTLTGAIIGLAGAAHIPNIVGFVLLPALVFGFLDTMYLAQENAYRDLFGDVVKSVRDKTYTLKCAYAMGPKIKFGHIVWSVFSWSVWPVYGGLIVAYYVASSTGWIAGLAQKTSS